MQSVPKAGGATAKRNIFSLPRFDFCLAPRDHVATMRNQPVLGLCGGPLCSGLHHDAELSVVRIPRCDIPRCGGHCAGIDTDVADASELSLVPEPLAIGSSALQKNLHMAKMVVRDIFTELESKSLAERCHYEESGTTPPKHKQNVWATYTNKPKLQRFAADSMEFIRQNAECRTRQLTTTHLRFVILLQHFSNQDTLDVYRPEHLKIHSDCFEGVLTDGGVNSQLVKDAHRSEYSVEGKSFTLQLPQDLDGDMHDEQSGLILKFQQEFVSALEIYLIGYCNRRGLSALGTRRLLQAVTTQMSQAGLANLDRGSQASRYFVGSHGLDQRTAYNLSSMTSPELGESLKLSILCMKTGFCQYLEKDELLRMPGVDSPKRCKPTSYLYQYATLRFTPGPPVDNCESTICTVLDALDEAHIDPITN